MNILKQYDFNTVPTPEENLENFLIVCRDGSGYKQVLIAPTKKAAIEYVKKYRCFFGNMLEGRTTHIFKIRRFRNPAGTVRHSNTKKKEKWN